MNHTTKAEIAKKRDDRIKAANLAHALFLKRSVQDKSVVANYVKFLDSFREAK